MALENRARLSAATRLQPLNRMRIGRRSGDVDLLAQAARGEVASIPPRSGRDRRQQHRVLPLNHVAIPHQHRSTAAANARPARRVRRTSLRLLDDALFRRRDTHPLLAVGAVASIDIVQPASQRSRSQTFVWNAGRDPSRPKGAGAPRFSCASSGLCFIVFGQLRRRAKNRPQRRHVS